MGNLFDIRVYGKGDGNIGVVFRKGRVLYRITSVVGGREFVNEMRGLYDAFSRGVAGREFAYKIICARGRHRYMEVVVEKPGTVLRVHELAGDDLKLRFCWKGTAAVFLDMLRQLDMVLSSWRF